MGFRKYNSVSKFPITFNALKSEGKLYKFFRKHLLFIIIYNYIITLLSIEHKVSLTIGNILIIKNNFFSFNFCTPFQLFYIVQNDEDYTDNNNDDQSPKGIENVNNHRRINANLFYVNFDV